MKPQHTKNRKCSVAESDNNSTASTAKKMKQSILTNALQKSINLDKLIVNFVVDTMSPMSIVENKSFRALIEGAQQLTRPPKLMCRRTCNNKIADAYTEYKGNLKNKLKAAQYVCTTADIWSSSRRSYLGMTVHWIDSDTFARNSSSLACRRFKGSHTFDKIAELIIEIHEQYDLRLSKITKTVTDNGSNMVKAFKIFGKPDLETFTSGGPLLNVDLENFEVNITENLDNNNQQDDDDNDDILALHEFPEPQENDLYQLPNHERCATHTLHLIPARDIDKARHKNNSYRKLHDAAMAKCQAVWNVCSRSPKASEIYLEVTGKSPTSPCPTRWNSYYNCITDILQVQETINEALRKLGLPVLKEIEIQFLVEYVRTSKPIAEAIRSLEGDKEIYYGCLQPELIRMQKILASLEMDNPVYCGPLIEIIKESIEKRFEKFDLEDTRSKDSILAAVSYPFFKLKWVPKNKKEHVKELFITEVRKFKNENLKSGLQSQTSERKKEKSESYYMFQDSDSSATSEGGSANTTIDLETLQYLKDECTSLEMLNAYPTIKKVFLKYNTSLPSSAPVERLFSYGGMIMRPHRRKMSDDVFEQLVLLKSVINKN